MTCEPRCLPCLWGAIPLVCAEVEKAIRADQERLDKRRFASAARVAVDPKAVAELHKALEGNKSAQRAAGRLTHALVLILEAGTE